MYVATSIHILYNFIGYREKKRTIHVLDKLQQTNAFLTEVTGMT